MTADATSAALGHDPLLIALHEPALAVQSGQVLAEFVDRSIGRVASSRGEHVPADYRCALLALGREMLERRQLEPLWSDLHQWPNLASQDRRLLGHVVNAGELLHLTGTSMTQRVAFRHDRIRDSLLIDAANDLLKAGRLEDEIVSDPYFAEILANILARGEVPEQFVDRVRDSNPLALFHALRLFQEPKTVTHERVLSAIDKWLDDALPADLGNQHLRWEMLAVLAQTDSSKALAFTRRFSSHSWSALEARFRNGDLSAGIELCSRLEPGSGAPWRDEQIQHAKLKFSSRFSKSLDQVLRTTDLPSSARSGALRLAGHLADPILREGIESSWISDSSRGERLDDYLWAAAECCGDNPDRYLNPICDAWAALPNESTDNTLPSPRDDLAANHVRWALRKWVPASAVPYFAKRAADEDLRWPITYMLHDIDHPLAVKLTMQAMASAMRRVEGCGSFSPFASIVRSDWRRRQEDGEHMSPSSRQLLLAHWTDANTDKYLREAAFRLWSATEEKGDLDILRSTSQPADLADSILRGRLARNDLSAIPELLGKLETEQNVFWWESARHVWSGELLTALDATLAKRALGTPPRWGAAEDIDFITSELVMRLSPEVGEELLERHWHRLRFSSPFVQAALYLATPTLLTHVQRTMRECPSPKELLKYVTLHFGIKTKGHPGIMREAQVAALIPYLKFLKSHDVRILWDCCNEHGWYDLRQKHLDPFIRENGGAIYLDDSRTMASLDDMVQKNTVYWLDSWLEDYARTGASTETMLTLLGKWLASRKTLASLRLVSQAVALIGRREDLTILDVNLEPDDPSADAIRADTHFAVMRRTLR